MLIKQKILALSRNLARLGINSGAIDVIMNRSLLEENNFFELLRLSFFSKFDWDTYIVCIALANYLQKNLSVLLFYEVFFV